MNGEVLAVALVKAAAEAIGVKEVGFLTAQNKIDGVRRSRDGQGG